MDWLVGHITILGVEIQNWILLLSFMFYFVDSLHIYNATI